MNSRVHQASRWMYRGVWRVLVDLFRVPDQPPTLPARDGASVHSFQPAPGYLNYLKLQFWIILIALDVALTGIFILIAVALWQVGLAWVALVLVPVALFVIIVPDIIAYIAIHLRYDTMWYVMTDRSLRIRRGIWSIHETTITFENVQNLKVQQGPLQRHFGIANLVVETAGAGGGGQNQKGAGGISNQGVVEGISNAAEIRERILARMRQSRTAGLGDDATAEDSRGTEIPTWTPAHLATLREIRDEVRLLAS